MRQESGDLPVRAKVICVEELSAHADSDGVLAWLRTAPRPPKTFYVVHGEEAASVALAGGSQGSWDGVQWCRVTPSGPCCSGPAAVRAQGRVVIGTFVPSAHPAVGVH